jgi:polyisoprenoid-binding protein YceI
MLSGPWGNASLAAWLFVQALTTTSGPGQVALTVDAANSQVVIQVGKAGLLGFAGHAHEVAAEDVRGQVTFDPSDLSRAAVSLEFQAAALRVTGKGEPPEDVAEVQRVMLSDRVLDVKRFPTISFRSRRVTVAAQSTTTADLRVDGDLTLHGTMRPMTVRVSAALDAEGRLTARGSCSLLQSDFGIVPVTAAGGTVRVRDAIDVRFVVRAQLAAAPRATRPPE